MENAAKDEEQDTDIRDTELEKEEQDEDGRDKARDAELEKEEQPWYNLALFEKIHGQRLLPGRS